MKTSYSFEYESTYGRKLLTYRIPRMVGSKRKLIKTMQLMTIAPVRFSWPVPCARRKLIDSTSYKFYRQINEGRNFKYIISDATYFN